MLSRLQIHYNLTVTNDLIHKFNYYNHYQIPNLSNIITNLNDINIVNNKNKLIDYLFLLEQFTNKKSYPIHSKQNNLKLKIKINQIIGCFNYLTKKQSFNLFELLILNFLPNQKNFNGIRLTKKQNSPQIMFKLNTWIAILPNKILVDYQLLNIYTNPLNILIKLKNKKNYTTPEFFCFLSSFNFPLNKKK